MGKWHLKHIYSVNRGEVINARCLDSSAKIDYSSHNKTYYVHVTIYRIAGYIGGNNVWRIARKRKNIAIGGYKFGGYGMIATPSQGVGAILADLILVV